MLVLVNPTAAGGRGLDRWRALAPGACERLGPCTVVAAADVTLARAAVARELAAGERRFVAAGGDGTVNLVMSTVVQRAGGAARDVAIGAIGLGSSNDFHKPRRSGAMLSGVPCRLDFEAAAARDVGRLVYIDANGQRGERLWLLNASVGATANANRLFTEPDPFLAWLKRRCTTAAMAYAAVRGILAARPAALTLGVGAATFSIRARNLGVVKSPHFAGALHYDSPLEPDNGRFHVHLLEAVSLPRLAAALLALARGRFTGRPGTRSWRAERVTIEAAEPFALETDGEVVVARRAELTLLPRAVRVCR